MWRAWRSASRTQYAKSAVKRRVRGANQCMLPQPCSSRDGVDSACLITKFLCLTTTDTPACPPTLRTTALKSTKALQNNRMPVQLNCSDQVSAGVGMDGKGEWRRRRPLYYYTILFITVRNTLMQSRHLKNYCSKLSFFIRPNPCLLLGPMLGPLLARSELYRNSLWQEQ